MWDTVAVSKTVHRHDAVCSCCCLIGCHAFHHSARQLSTTIYNDLGNARCQDDLEFIFGKDARPKFLNDLLPERFGPCLLYTSRRG